MEWQDLAKCVDADTNIFFSAKHKEEAKEYCDACVVTDQCLEDAMAYRSFGFWAGTTPDQRLRMEGRHNNRRPDNPVLLLFS